MPRTAQQIANDIGAQMRTLEGYALGSLNQDIIDSAATLHATLTEGFMFLSENAELGIDWDQVAGVPPGQPSPQAGDKHE